MTLVVMFPYLPGSESAAFRGVSVFLGVFLSLGSSSAIAYAVAGTILSDELARQAPRIYTSLHQNIQDRFRDFPW